MAVTFGNRDGQWLPKQPLALEQQQFHNIEDAHAFYLVETGYHGATGG
jgi:hypothetical protein